ncbi:MAG TPA: carboxyl transferase domain-containing protein, partial [Conexibacter sp.]|nr:carboxyl transferase domain-containing protein [Conexibacter sp.]
MSGTATETEPARALLARLCDDLVDLPGGWTSSDPLEWPGYREQLERAALRSGETESVIAATATIAGTPVVALAFDFRFLGGSMGEATGRRIVAALRHAFEARLPVVSFVASGGARMQEGMRSLVQMQEIAAAVARLRAGGIPHLSVLRHPTTGGVWASFAATADVIVAMRGGIVSFAGPRVRGDEHELDAAFTAEGKVAAGFADRVVDAVELPDVLARYVGLLGRALRQGAVGAPAPCGADAAREPSRGGWETVVAARDAA